VQETILMDSMAERFQPAALLPQRVQTPLGAVEYAEFGEGPTVLALHGAMGGYDQSAILARTILSGSHRVIAVSRPGYLATPLSSGATPEAQADLAAAMLDALAIERAAVIAISGGGPAAIHFALRHPARCRALVLCSTVSRANTFKIPFRFQLIKLLAHLPFLASRMRETAMNNLKKAAQRSITNPALLQNLMADPEAWMLFRDLTLSTFDCMAQRMAGSENDFRITQTYEYPLEKITAPTLIVHGSDDPFVNFAEHAETASRRIARAELLTLAGGEHAAIFTHREIVKRRLGRFLAESMPY
jgi:pimeloyl-ACP methyl ester carboxylesterase